MAAVRTSLVEQKRIQWAREREEMSRLMGNSNVIKIGDPVRTTVRTHSYNTKGSISELSSDTPNRHHHHPHPHQRRLHHRHRHCYQNDVDQRHQLRSDNFIEPNTDPNSRYASTMSLRSLTGSDFSNDFSRDIGNCVMSASLINLRDERCEDRRRSPSLPPICKTERYNIKELQQDLKQQQSKSTHRCWRNKHRIANAKDNTAAKMRQNRTEEVEGETSGYASDSNNFETQQRQTMLLPCHVNCSSPDLTTSEKIWQNPYRDGESSLPSSRKLASIRAGAAAGSEFNRQRWGSVWGQDSSKDPPPPSWLERGLSRLGHNSQVLVINHDSASSPDSSTTGSYNGSEANKTYLRGQNQPIDADILQEREVKRQKALELQTAIKQQLEERESRKKEERENKLKEERDEEERIKRQQSLEKQRLEEEQRKQKERELAKQKKSKAMQESLEVAERRAKEEKRLRRRKDDGCLKIQESPIEKDLIEESNKQVSVQQTEQTAAYESLNVANIQNLSKIEKIEEAMNLPVSQEVTIVLSGRIDDPELLKNSPMKLVNLVVSPTSPRNLTSRNEINLSALINNLNQSGQIIVHTPSSRSSPRLLTPSKYRSSSGRECATQTDCEGDTLTDYTDKEQERAIKEVKDHKDASNKNRRDAEKSTNTGNDDTIIKSFVRSKPQARTTMESRPRWNANRPGTRYRTQSEKDPHYQRKMRLRRRQVETSDEGSSDFQPRSPSPSRRKHGIIKAKTRNSAARRIKANIENYDDDYSMDSLNSLVPLQTDENGRINVRRRDDNTFVRNRANVDNDNREVWCGAEIISHLTSLRNGLMMKKKEWDLQEYPITPITELY